MEASELTVEPEEQTPGEHDDIGQAEAAVRAYLRTLRSDQERPPTLPKLVFEDGRQIALPPSVLKSLQFVLDHMARGDAISLVPMAKMLTTN